MRLGISSTKKIGICLFVVAIFIGLVYWDRRENKVHEKQYSLSALEGKDNLVPFLVLGSGPASLSAALYGARTKIRTVVLKGNQPGGQLTTTSYVENWPGIPKELGRSIMTNFEEQAEGFGAIMVSDVVMSIDFSNWPYKVVTEEGRVMYAMAIMIGTGSTPRRLSIPGEQEYWGKGVTTCAICDAPYHQGHKVVVIGGGDSAMEEALELSSYAQHVVVFVRGSELKASPSMIERVKDCNNVTIEFNRMLTEIKGDGEHVKTVMVKDTKTGEITEELMQGVFLAIGHMPNTQLVKDAVACDSHGYIQLSTRTQQTTIPGVFAAGDVSDPRYKQAGVAAGDGIKAGLDCMWWLGEMGYNKQVQESLEPFFFEPGMPETSTVGQLITLDDLKLAIKDSGSKLMLLDFYTKHCPSCMHMMPVLEWASQKMADTVAFYKVDASLALDLVRHFKVPEVPHLVLLKDGKVIDHYPNTMTRTELYSYLKKYLKAS